ncbi:MAG: hypothetical protein AAFP84_17160, partial [Actinomycetota bacterium]
MNRLALAASAALAGLAALAGAPADTIIVGRTAIVTAVLAALGGLVAGHALAGFARRDQHRRQGVATIGVVVGGAMTTVLAAAIATTASA